MEAADCLGDEVVALKALAVVGEGASQLPDQEELPEKYFPDRCGYLNLLLRQGKGVCIGRKFHRHQPTAQEIYNSIRRGTNGTWADG